MKRINKKKSGPKSLSEHKSKTHADYDNYSDKDDLRMALLDEQGHICCYCMQRIKLDRMKIEHYQCQDRYPEKQLDYNNLFGACLGNEGQRHKNQHCDTKKGKADIKVNPTDLNRNCEDLIQYSSTGKISSKDPEINRDLNETLNLNMETLKKNRRTVINTVITQLESKFPQQTWRKSVLAEKIQQYSSLNAEGKYSEYCAAVTGYLKQRLGIKPRRQL
jgi:uncharacterized protein (TIGR02646 family)